LFVAPISLAFKCTTSSLFHKTTTSNVFDMKTQLVWIALGHKAVSLLILFASGYLPDFDQSSPHTHSRWDTLHYAAISKHGYSFENQFAFFPGAPFFAALFPSQLTAGIVFGLFSIPSTIALYDLSLLVLKSPSKAYLAALLSIFTSSPAVVHISGCPEPLFTFCTYRGLLECARKRWYAAALLFMIAGTLRSNGILLAGFHLWYLLIRPFITTRKVYTPALF
jgi:Gpi18-like mannosyltransferase